jgi:hypothetical protein
VANKTQRLVEESLGRRLQMYQGREDASSRPVGRGRGKLQFAEVPPEVLALYRIKAAVPRVPPLIVREYAGPRPGAEASSRHVDVDTILWQPVIVLPAEGKASITFPVGKAAGYEVIVAGHTLDGRIGAVRTIVPVAPAGQLAVPTPVIPAGPDKR